ncbi:response regulator transcription factor [Sedimentitalea sp. HM32M-2]|uniref:response regulator transcription factor n=1 Tax=Sedimentitalea sp. HM32M-2 TaxID=3351566 RepID=UPI00363AF901
MTGNLPTFEEIEAFRRRFGKSNMVILGSAPVVGEISHEISSSVEAVITDDLSAVSLIGLLSAVREGFRISLPEESRLLRERSSAESGFAAQSTGGLHLLRMENGTASGLENVCELPAAENPADATAPRMATLEEIARETKLSAREMAVIQKLRDGASNKDIAKKLNIVENTVKVHLRSCYRKIGVKNRTQAAVWAAKYLPR